MMTEAARLATVGVAFGHETRAAILCALMSGTAHTNAELSRSINVARSSISEHVSVLLDAGLVTVHAQGRHRYVGLAGADIADLVERLGVLSTVAAVSLPMIPPSLRIARSCYRHLAGSLGVTLADSLLHLGAVGRSDHGLRVTTNGVAVLADLGIHATATDVDDLADPATLRPCLDWSERRPHFAGSLADTMLARFIELDWLRRRPEARRALIVTPTGRSGLFTHFRLDLP
jgi:DNA-binding transcriptional ArsR family regulator